MTDIINLSTRARNKKKKKRLDDKRDTSKMIKLLKEAEQKFKSYGLETIATGFNESPLKQRVTVTVSKDSFLRFKLIPLKSY